MLPSPSSTNRKSRGPFSDFLAVVLAFYDRDLRLFEQFYEDCKSHIDASYVLVVFLLKCCNAPFNYSSGDIIAP